MPLTPFAHPRPRKSVAVTTDASSDGSSRSSLGGSGSKPAFQPGYSTPVRRPYIRNVNTPQGSPFQSYSPSSPLSKSTILPFDAEGSARAAAEARKKQQSASVAGSSGSPKKRKGFVRKASFWERLGSLPHRIVEYVEPDSWTPPPASAKYIAGFLHTVHLLVRLNASYSRRRRRAIFKEDRGPLDPLSRYEAQKSERIPVTWMCWIIFGILMALSLANALYLFSSTRRYDMMHRSNPVDSPNAKAVAAPDIDTRDTDYSNDSTLGNKVWRFVLAHGSPVPLIRLLLGWPSSRSPSTPSSPTRMMQTLYVWDPPEFNAEFFIFYSPFLPPVIQFFSSDNLKTTLVFVLLLIGQTRFIFRSFEQLVKDKMILQREVMKEYDETFVYKKLYSTRMDKSVQTSEAEMLR